MYETRSKPRHDEPLTVRKEENEPGNARENMFEGGVLRFLVYFFRSDFNPAISYHVIRPFSHPDCSPIRKPFINSYLKSLFVSTRLLRLQLQI